MYKTIFLTLFYLNIGFSASPINSMAKSFLIPGWGEMDFGYKKSSKFFIQSEIILLTGCFSAFKASNLIKKKYITYANDHSGASSASDDRYWVDIGNYNTNLSYDFEHLRMRDDKEGQWQDFPWDWDDNDYKRKKFENMRIASDKYYLGGKFLIGGIIMNHIISAINTLYIIRLNEDEKLSLKSSLNYNQKNLQYIITMQF